MDTINVDKQDLIEVLETNRAAHRAIFEEAMVGWRKQVEAELDRMVQRVMKDKNYNHLYIGLEVPKDHTRDYDRVILMLKMDINPSVELTEQEFAEFVQDDWNWRRQFLGTTANYSATAAVANATLNGG